MIRLQFSGAQLDLIAEGSPQALIFVIRAVAMANDNHANHAESAEGLEQLARTLFEKAIVYLDALRLEASPITNESEIRTLQFGLFQDFVEVHNAALKWPIELPEHKDDLDKLLGSLVMPPESRTQPTYQGHATHS